MLHPTSPTPTVATRRDDNRPSVDANPAILPVGSGWGVIGLQILNSSGANVDETDATDIGASTTTETTLLPSHNDNGDEEEVDDVYAQENDDENDDGDDEASVIGHDNDDILSGKDKTHSIYDEIKSPPPPPKPVKRAPTAYSIFCDENRSKIQTEVSRDQILGRWTVTGRLRESFAEAQFTSLQQQQNLLIYI